MARTVCLGVCVAVFAMHSSIRAALRKSNPSHHSEPRLPLCHSTVRCSFSGCGCYLTLLGRCSWLSGRAGEGIQPTLSRRRRCPGLGAGSESASGRPWTLTLTLTLTLTRIAQASGGPWGHGTAGLYAAGAAVGASGGVVAAGAGAAVPAFCATRTPGIELIETPEFNVTLMLPRRTRLTSRLTS